MINYLMLLILTVRITEPYFEMNYKCDGVKGKITHIVSTDPRLCERKLYSVIHNLNQACKEVKIEGSYCGFGHYKGVL